MTQELDKELARLLSLELKEEILPGQTVSMHTHEAWNSLKQIEIIMSVEEFFGVSFSAQEIPTLTSQAILLARLRDLKGKDGA